MPNLWRSNFLVFRGDLRQPLVLSKLSTSIWRFVDGPRSRSEVLRCRGRWRNGSALYRASSIISAASMRLEFAGLGIVKSEQRKL